MVLESSRRPRLGAVRAGFLASVASLALLMSGISVSSAATTPTSVGTRLVTTATAAGPSAAALATAATTHRSSTTSAHIARSTVVRLLTGDRVRLDRWTNGTTTTSMLPGSPSYGKPVQTFHTPSGDYLVPKLAPEDQSRFDLSVFNVSRLARLAAYGRPARLRLTYDRQADIHQVAGLTVRPKTALRAGSDRIRVRATYSPADASGAPKLTGTWAGVTSVSLPSAQPQTPRLGSSTYEMHTLTIKVNGPGGHPVRWADAWVQNVANASLFTAPVPVLNGSVKVSVPDGPYSIMVGGFSWIAVEPDRAIDADTTVTLDAADSTTRPKVLVGADTKPISTTVQLTRRSERGGSFVWAFGGDRFYVKLPRVPATLPHGSLTTSVAATLAPRHSGHRLGNGVMIYPKQIYTRDIRSGIPARLSFRHHRSEFAILHHDFYRNGPSRTTFRYVFPALPSDFFVFIEGIPVELGSRSTVWLQGGRRLHWLQSADGIMQFHRPFKYADMNAPVRVYKPGRVRRPMAWFRGPVGPGLERRINARGIGACLLCRYGNQLFGELPLWNSAGTSLSGVLYARSMGSWALRMGRHRLQGGHYLISPHVRLPRAKRSYTLTAQAEPRARSWRLSTQVRDRWTFESARGQRVVPLLMPRYVLPTDLDSRVAPGRVHFRLTFDNLGPASASVRDAAVRFSDDGGATWRRARLTRLDGNTFRVGYDNPERTAAHRFVSLRVRGTDAAGREVTETAIRAYRIGRHHSAADTRASGPRTFPGQAQGARPACDSSGGRTYTCFALVEAAGRAALRSNGDPAGWGATDLRDAYELTGHQAGGQTVAVVVAGDYPTAEADLGSYRRQFGLPPCTSANGCFTKINQNGRSGNYPRRDHGWALEAALDLQMISAACPSCRLVLAEANEPSDTSIDKAVDAAVHAGATVTNHSYGVQEYHGVRANNPHYSVPGVTAVSATGDFGFQPASFPASSPDVVAVGGTVLHHADNARGWRERAWLWGGSGCSGYFQKPAYQADPACHMRTIGDLAAVADGLAVYDSFGLYGHRGWFVVGGTSASSPLVAGMIGAAGAGGLTPGKLYAHPAAFHDVSRGSNGFCRGSYICTARPGYDAPTGLGTPRGLAPFTTP